MAIDWQPSLPERLAEAAIVAPQDERYFGRLFAIINFEHTNYRDFSKLITSGMFRYVDVDGPRPKLIEPTETGVEEMLEAVSTRIDELTRVKNALLRTQVTVVDLNTHDPAPQAQQHAEEVSTP